MKAKPWRVLCVLVLALSTCSVMRWKQLVDATHLNYLAVSTARTMSAQKFPVALQDDLAQNHPRNCHWYWLGQLTSDNRIPAPPEIPDARAALLCSPLNVVLAESLTNAELPLAQLAIIYQPEASESWFWVGRALAIDDYENAVSAYRHGLAISPYSGIAWLELANLLLAHSSTLALDSYYQACLNGDPGKHGCYGAGSLAERLGNIEAAIYYYGLSDWAYAIERAHELEIQLAPSRLP